MLSALELFSMNGYIVKRETKRLLLDQKTWIQMWKSIGEARALYGRFASPMPLISSVFKRT
jgi:hypothetical protein